MKQEEWDNLIEAMGGVDPRELTDEQLKDYCAACYNDFLDCQREMWKRNIEL
jgi:hypothetical protein